MKSRRGQRVDDGFVGGLLALLRLSCDGPKLEARRYPVK